MYNRLTKMVHLWERGATAMKKKCIACILVFTLSMVFPSCKKSAEFEVSNLVISPTEIAIGESAVVTIDVDNVGDIEGTYGVTLTVGGIKSETKQVTVIAGAKVPVTFTIEQNTPGTFQIGVNGLVSTLKILKPAEFKVTSLRVNPESILPGQRATIEANVTNIGETGGIYRVILNVDGKQWESKDTTLRPGETKTISFFYSPETAGVYHLQVEEIEGYLEALEPAPNVTGPVSPGLRPTQIARQPTPLASVPPPTSELPVPGKVATVMIYPPLLILSVEGTATGTLTIEARDADGNTLGLAGRQIVFKNSRPDIVAINNIGTVTTLKAQTTIFETAYISVAVDGVTSLNVTLARVTRSNLSVSWDSYDLFQGQNVAFYMPREAAGIAFGEVMRNFDVAGATDVAYLLEKELTGLTPFHGMMQIFVGEPGESEELRVCGISGNPIRLGYNVNKPPNCIREPEGNPHWGVIWHEMGHNFTFTSVRFGQLCQGSSFYSEALATLVMMYAEYRITSDTGHFGLTDVSSASIGGNSYGALGFNRRVYLVEGLGNYEATGADFKRMDANILDGIFSKLAETYGWNIFPRLFKIFLPADTPWDLLIQANTEARKHAVIICALSVATGTDLREQFKKWNFPIDDIFYDQIKSQIASAIQN